MKQEAVQAIKSVFNYKHTYFIKITYNITWYTTDFIDM